MWIQERSGYAGTGAVIVPVTGGSLVMVFESAVVRPLYMAIEFEFAVAIGYENER